MTVDILLFTDCASRAFIRTAGAHAIASVLRNAGYTVQVVDYFLLAGLEKTLAVIDKFVGANTLFVGWSTTFMNLSGQHLIESETNKDMFNFDGFERAKFTIGTAAFSHKVPISDDAMNEIRNRIKLKNPTTKLVMGGVKSDNLAQAQMDVFVLGYAEDEVLQLVKYLEGKNPFFQFHTNDAGQMIIDYDVNAEKFDFQHSVMRHHESDLIGNHEVLGLETARGCIFKCKFCNFRLVGKKKNDYTKIQESFYSELMDNYERFGTTRYSFADDTYNESVSKLEQMAEVINRLPFKLEFVAYLRHDLIQRFPDMADLLKDSGLKVAVFGIETLNHEAGKIIGKGLHPEKTRELLHWLRTDKNWKGNVLMNSGFIVGLPGENINTVTKWVEELMDYDYPLDSFLVNPLGLNPLSAKLTKSEFEKNYAQYGYYFDPAKSTGWINEHWRVEDTREFCKEVDKCSVDSGRIKLYGFNALTLRGYGFDWDQLHNSLSLDYGNEIFYKTLAFSKKYYERLLT